MQYIHKQNTQPPLWDNWFLGINGLRTYQYSTPPLAARQHLIEEQFGLCAYCQREISKGNSTIEHVIPNSVNQPLSTSYHNLVAVCTNFRKNSGDKLHCDKSRGNILLPPIIFHSDFTCPNGSNFKLFACKTDGSIEANIKKYDNSEWSIYMQIMGYIDILNLNHDILKSKRKEILDCWWDSLKGKSPKQKREFWRFKYDSILRDPRQPFRQFLLIYLTEKI